MATYFVRTDGNDANTGTGQATNQAWRTIQKALGATGISSGDTVYIAPGRYNEFITVGMTSATTTTYIIGDVGATQFIGITPGVVRLTAHTTDAVNATSTALITATSKNYLYWQGIYFEQGNSVQSAIATCRYWTFTKCTFVNAAFSNSGYTFTNTAGTPFDLTVSKCIFACGYGLWIRNTKHSASYDIGVNISDCLCYGINNSSQPVFYFDSTGSGTDGNGAKIFNCTLHGTSISNQLTSTTTPLQVTNCLGVLTSTFFGGSATSAASVITNCRYPNSSVSNATVTNSSSLGVIGLDFSQSMLGASIGMPIPSPYDNSILINAGTSTGAPLTDIYGYNWTSGTDIGAFSRTSLSSSTFYYPTERNASAITIAPGSTSQSIELYLGATGLTASTSGLSARYNRTRTASVSIPLVARTIAQAWTSGGFAEVDATNMPGVYRLDLPDAALAAGADDVTIVVRGASGTNGAVMTVKLSSGGLSSTETAQAVWNATASSYNTAGSMGEAGQKLTGYSLSSAGNTSAADAVWNSTRSTHTTAGTFGQYVNAELVTPVTSAALVRMGPFQVIADGVATPMPLDIQKGAQHGVDIQCVDNNLSAIDITSATVTAKVYNSGATLVDTYSCTATYAADGRATFTIDTTVTNTPGTYTATITRTTGASDTQIFGPLRIYVRDI